MTRWIVVLGLTVSAAGRAVAQSQASTIQVSRDLHDLGWAATGVATTFTLRELGVRPRSAAIFGSVGVVLLAKGLECAKWCGNPKVDWPASVALKDAAYDVVLSSAAVPLLVGKQKGWKAGVATGAAWLATIFVLRQAKWNSP